MACGRGGESDRVVSVGLAAFPVPRARRRNTYTGIRPVKSVYRLSSRALSRDGSLAVSQRADSELKRLHMMSLTVSLTRVLALSPICAVNQSRRLQCSRRFSTSTLPPSIQRFTHELANQQPCFAMSASGVSILTEPCQFYQSLLVSHLIDPACPPTGMSV